jgi:hypothetical protein
MNNKKARKTTWVTSVALLTLGAIPLRLGAQAQNEPNQARRYIFIDLGTLGGPNSYVYGADYSVTPGAAGCTDSDTCGHAYVLTPCGGGPGDMTDAAPCPAESGVAEAPVTHSIAAKSASAPLRTRMNGRYPSNRLGTR